VILVAYVYFLKGKAAATAVTSSLSATARAVMSGNLSGTAADVQAGLKQV
jgi:hypothetical protein